jgi:AraC family transcriptional activator of pobA
VIAGRNAKEAGIDGLIAGMRFFGIDVRPVETLPSPRDSSQQAQRFICEHGGLVFLCRGRCDLRSSSTCRSVAAPALSIMPSGAQAEIAFSAAAAGFVVTAEDSVLHALSAREPAFEVLFREPRDLSLSGLDPAFKELESGILRLMCELHRSESTQVTAAEAHLHLLLTSALRCFHRTTPVETPNSGSAPKRAARLVDGFLRLVRAHHHRHWPLREYACALHVSSGHLRASCVRIVGASPLELIHECVMAEAKRRLAFTALSISAIALDLGFDDPAYFSRLFHSKCGLSPTQYRVSLVQHGS